MGLARYGAKRDFGKTPEPRGKVKARRATGGIFVVQKHDATRLHYDFRLEMDGVLKSWAVPKGPSLDPADKRLAVHVEDHPIEYATFEGVIPKGEYGGGPVIVWDRGKWHPEGDPHAGYAAGSLKFELEGEKLRGGFALVRMHGAAGGDKNWLLIKHKDGEARHGREAAVTERHPESVKSGRKIEELDGKAATAPRRKPRARATARPKPPPRTSRSSKAPTVRVAKRASSGARPGIPKLAGAVRAPMPDTAASQLATLVDHPPEGDDWIHEIKFDGYRLIARLDAGKVALITRNGKDWTEHFPTIAEPLATLPVRRAILDGELVSIQRNGTTSFQGLQASLRGEHREALRYFAFDLLYLDGHDLGAVPLLQRKEALERLLRRAPKAIRYSEHVQGQGEAFFDAACGRGLEGVVSKLASGAHTGRRTRDWQKVKCGNRQELVIAGYTRHSAVANQVGALLLGVFDAKRQFRYAGKVGTGFSEEVRRDLKTRLDRLGRKSSPFQEDVPERGAVWAEPRLVAEVTFTEWTSEGRLRHPSFVGLREDKPARDVVREAPAPTSSDPAPNRTKASARSSSPMKSSRVAAPAARRSPRSASRQAAPADDAAVAGIALSHPDRVLWKDVGVTKRDLARHYEIVAPYMLPQVAERPLMLMRCPSGSQGQCFFQKHFVGDPPQGVRIVPIAGKEGTEPYVAVDELEGLVSLVQLGALELHGWGARSDLIEKPDRIVLDLDPAPDVAFPAVMDAAREVRDVLNDLGLTSFVKTTGGKGLHVEVPLDRVHDWETVKTFSRSVAETLVKIAPERYVAQASKAKRTGKIFVDWLRNGRGATAIVAYSTRARPGAPVAVPLAWDELEKRLRPERWTLSSVPKRLATRFTDPWKRYRLTRQRLPHPRLP